MNKYNSYKVTFHNSYYVYDKKEGASEWNEGKVTSKTFSGYKSYANAYKAMQNMAEEMERKGLTSVSIDDVCCGQVYEWTPELIKCDCCKNEVWETIEQDTHHETPTREHHLPDKS